MIRRVFWIAWGTLQEVARHKMLSVHLIFLLISVGLFNMFAHFSTSPSLEYKMIQDVGISFIFLFGFLLTLFIGSSTLKDELERRTAYAILTLPMPRWEFYLGKSLGTLAATMLNMGIMIVIFTILLYAKFGTFWSGSLWMLAFMTMEFAIITSVILLLSLANSSVMTFSFTMFLVIMGNLKQFVSHLTDEAGIIILDWMVWAAYCIIPNFAYFNMKARILKGGGIPYETLMWAAAYTATYVAVATLIGMFSISRRDV